MKYLTKVVETYRVDSEQEVEDFLQELKKDPRFEVIKYSSTRRDIKVKGEIADSYIRLEVTKSFDDEKEPSRLLEVQYAEYNEN